MSGANRGTTLHERATRRAKRAAVVLTAAALAVVVVIASMLLRWERGPIAPSGPDGTSGPGPGGTPAGRSPGPRLIVRFDRDTYTLEQDTEMQITIEGVKDAPPAFVLTDRMLMRADLEWKRYELKDSPDGPFEKTTANSGTSGPVPGNPAFQELGEAVNLPTTVYLPLYPHLMDAMTTEIMPGPYRVRLALVSYVFGFVLRSEYFRIRLQASAEPGDGARTPAKWWNNRRYSPRLDVRFDRDTYTIGRDTEVQVTIEGVRYAPPDFVLTDKMLARTKLEWLVEIESSRTVQPDGSIKSMCYRSTYYGSLSMAGHPAYREPGEAVRLPTTVRLPLEPNFTEPQTSRVYPGLYHVWVVAIGFGRSAKSAMFSIRLLAPEETDTSPVSPAPEERGNPTR